MKRLIAIATSAAMAFAVGQAVAVATSAPAHALGNGLALTPPMGWNDWNAFHCNTSAPLVEQTAAKMVSNGMKAAGYQYVNIDDCWLEKQRDANGNLVPDPTKFPNGIKSVADYVHSLGLKLGIYNDAGTATCAGYPGSLGHEKQDAATFASWGVDYLKYDNCNNAGSTTTQQYIDRYTAMRDALAATGRPMVYSICEWGINNPATWAPQVGNLWRTTGDISDSYASMLSNFTQNVPLYPYAGPGAWNDPDMLEVGNGGMTTSEYQSEFSLWAEMAAPLISGTDLRTISPADLAIYTNKQVIAVDQDPLGKQAVPVPNNNEPPGDHGLWVLSKPLANGDRAVVLFNSTDSPTQISTTAAQVGMSADHSYTLSDLWAHQTTETAGVISADVPAHGSVMYRVAPQHGHGQRGVAPNVSLGMTGLPSSATPGQPATVTATFTDNGAQSVQNPQINVSAPAGWSVTRTSGGPVATAVTGQPVTATFDVTPTAPTQPIETDPVTATASYQWNRQTLTTSAQQTTTTVSPVQAPYQTYSSAAEVPAVFGQVGQNFAIDGAGSDLFNGADEYSTIYQKGLVANTSTIQTEVTGQQNMSGYAKAGILVRDDITGSGTTPEGVILFESPSGGIQMEWDSNGGNYINSVQPANGTIPDTLPVWLKLVKNGSAFTGYYSTDGQTWTQVASVNAPGQAATQDAGLFMESHSSGSTGTVNFTGYHVS